MPCAPDSFRQRTEFSDHMVGNPARRSTAFQRPEKVGAVFRMRRHDPKLKVKRMPFHQVTLGIIRYAAGSGRSPDEDAAVFNP